MNTKTLLRNVAGIEMEIVPMRIICVGTAMKFQKVTWNITVDFVVRVFTQRKSHRKTHHSQTLPRCRNYINGKCTFGLECWYHHKNANESQPVVFQQVQEEYHPPDMTPRMMDLMEKMMERMATLEEMMMSK